MENELKTVESSKKRSPLVPVIGVVVLAVLGVLSYFFVQTPTSEVVPGTQIPTESTETETDVQPSTNTDETTPPVTQTPTTTDPDVSVEYAIISPTKKNSQGVYHTTFLVSLGFTTTKGLTGTLTLDPKIACKQTDREETTLTETRSSRTFTYDCISDNVLVDTGTFFTYSTKTI